MRRPGRRRHWRSSRLSRGRRPALRVSRESQLAARAPAWPSRRNRCALRAARPVPARHRPSPGGSRSVRRLWSLVFFAVLTTTPIDPPTLHQRHKLPNSHAASPVDLPASPATVTHTPALLAFSPCLIFAARRTRRRHRNHRHHHAATLQCSPERHTAPFGPLRTSPGGPSGTSGTPATATASTALYSPVPLSLVFTAAERIAATYCSGTPGRSRQVARCTVLRFQQ